MRKAIATMCIMGMCGEFRMCMMTIAKSGTFFIKSSSISSSAN